MPEDEEDAEGEEEDKDEEMVEAKKPVVGPVTIYSSSKFEGGDIYRRHFNNVRACPTRPCQGSVLRPHLNVYTACGICVSVLTSRLSSDILCRNQILQKLNLRLGLLASTTRAEWT